MKLRYEPKFKGAFLSVSMIAKLSYCAQRYILLSITSSETFSELTFLVKQLMSFGPKILLKLRSYLLMIKICVAIHPRIVAIANVMWLLVTLFR